MNFSQRNISNPAWIFLITSIVSIFILICCACLIGFHFETKKFKAFLTTLTFVLIYQFLIADILLFIIKAFYHAIYRRLPYLNEVNPAFIGGPNRKEFLKRRINALKIQLELGISFYKRNEALTLKYKEILSELILYGTYFVVLLALIVGTRDPDVYYNTRTIKDVILNPKFSPFGTKSITTSDDLYKFINGTIFHGFTDATSYDGKPYPESGWVKYQIAKVLGVVRLRQLRQKHLNQKSIWETSSHEPGWLKEFPSLPFKDKFWRIFKPWEHQDNTLTGALDETGKIHHQPGSGYVALLGRNIVNSKRVLNFLQKNNWIDSYTAVIFIEFTLYNVDADMFTLVVISAEQTGFNSLVVTHKIDTLKLLFNIDNLEWYVHLTFLLYFLILTKILTDVILKLWYTPSMKNFFSQSWNYVDLTIVILNISIAICVWIREVYVKSLLLQLETSRKNEFVPFYHAAKIDETCTMLVAFLIALTTIRLWKILQFARVFRVLTSTLHHAKMALTSTAFFVAIFLIGIGLGSYIINGSNSPSFAVFMKSITSLMTLSFGFGSSIKPSEMNYGGSVIGFIFYLTLVVTITIFLLNMFITIVCLHFSKEKENDFKKSENADNYTFWDFLKMEMKECFLFEFFNKEKMTGSADFSLKNGDGKISVKKRKQTRNEDEEERLKLIFEILETQMKLIEEIVQNEHSQEGDEQIKDDLNENK